MPTFPVRRGGRRLYRALRFGRHVDLFVLDERQYRAAQPCGNARGPSGPRAATLPRPCSGRQQLAFARGGSERSKATWKVIANEVVMMPIKPDDQTFDAWDAWQGYPVEREALLADVKGVDDVVFVTGDYHAFIAGDVRTADGTTVATEFVGGLDLELDRARGQRDHQAPRAGARRDAPAMPAADLAAPQGRQPLVLRARLPAPRLRRVRGLEVLVQGHLP